jgi:REP element-mobilizing transposase RayT
MEAEARMAEDACRLDAEQRNLVEKQIGETCTFRGWELHAVNCRSNHVHVVVTANVDPNTVRNQLKAWSTRRLKQTEAARRQVSSGGDSAPIRENWWAFFPASKALVYRVPSSKT